MLQFSAESVLAEHELYLRETASIYASRRSNPAHPIQWHLELLSFTVGLAQRGSVQDFLGETVHRQWCSNSTYGAMICDVNDIRTDDRGEHCCVDTLG